MGKGFSKGWRWRKLVEFWRDFWEVSETRLKSFKKEAWKEAFSNESFCSKSSFFGSAFYQSCTVKEKLFKIRFSRSNRFRRSRKAILSISSAHWANYKLIEFLQPHRASFAPYREHETRWKVLSPGKRVCEGKPPIFETWKSASFPPEGLGKRNKFSPLMRAPSAKGKLVLLEKEGALEVVTKQIVSCETIRGFANSRWQCP